MFDGQMSLSSVMIQDQPRRSIQSIYHHTILMPSILTDFILYNSMPSTVIPNSLRNHHRQESSSAALFCTHRVHNNGNRGTMLAMLDHLLTFLTFYFPSCASFLFLFLNLYFRSLACDCDWRGGGEGGEKGGCDEESGSRETHFFEYDLKTGLKGLLFVN